MAVKRAKRQNSRNAVNKRQGGLLDLSWADYLPEDIGALVQSAMVHGRGVLLGTSPSGQLLVMRVYHDSGFTPLFARSLQGLVERVHKVFGTIVLSEPLSAIGEGTLEPAPLYGSVGYLVGTLGWPDAKAEAFSREMEDTREWARRTPILDVAARISLSAPPPL